MNDFYDITADHCLIGACLNIDDTFKKAEAAGITAEHFDEPLCATIWSTMLAIGKRGAQINMAGVYDFLVGKKINNLAVILAECVSNGPLTTNPDYFIDRLLERKWAALASSRLEQAKRDVARDPDLDLQQVISDLSDRPTSRGLGLSGYEVANEVGSEIEKRIVANGQGTTFGIPTGWQSLDALIHGFSPESFNVLAGRPSMGKTSLALSFAIDALKRDVPVLFFTIEMPRVDLSKKIISNLSGVDLTKILKGTLDRHETDLVYSATKKLSSMPITIVDDVKTIERINKEAVRRHKRGECDMVFVDYIQLCDSMKRFNSIREKVVHITHSMKTMAKEIKSPVIGLAQISRIKTGDLARKPTIEDLKESGSIEEDADTVLMIHREPYYKTGLDNWLIVGKSRHGERGEVKFSCNLSRNRFAEQS